MIKPFMNEDFLLDNEVARALYHDYAASMPIYDYHCHLPPADIASDRRFENMTRIWLAGDHYKWRAMRALGVPERLITGNGSDWEKFLAWAQSVPATLRNPLYHWTHMELRRPFGITELMDEASAPRIWARCNELLAEPSFSVQGILRAMSVRVVCTTDDPTSDLAEHAEIRRKALDVVVVPTFRPDAAMRVESTASYRLWISRLEAASGRSISSYRDLIDALRRRHAAFHEAGCRLSDHGIDEPYVADFTEAQVSGVFRKALDGRPLDPLDILRFRAALMVESAHMDAERGWTQQLHLSALRNQNRRMTKALGPDTGYDGMGDVPIARSLAGFLDLLDSAGSLPKTIIYTLNPAQNEAIASMIGSFQDGSVRGKVQFGSGWWFNDQLDGMSRQMGALANMGILSTFLGMLTDSRSFLSYPRHDYFRRLLCSTFGAEVAAGLLPDDRPLLGGMVQDICYRNAWRYFQIPGVRP